MGGARRLKKPMTSAKHGTPILERALQSPVNLNVMHMQLQPQPETHTATEGPSNKPLIAIATDASR
eukprot:2678927-Prorocentrum_lima.AAC.1